ncbi:MAG: M23 family metallopeptidase [Proteiniphilum sp.]|nr:M23 family metallopeptidase [Proteiniphilum sp.]
MRLSEFLSALFLLFAAVLPVHAQQYGNPLNIPPALSGNFGELRNDHFHSGIDFKTRQTVDEPVVAIEDGYVSRISVSPGGYGLALYIDHPSTGHTSVYAHLNGFSKEIGEWVREQQYLQETFAVTLYPEAGRFPVKRGEQVALSGNTGSSGGPHLHFEIRDTFSEEALDALEFLAEIPDTRRPDIQGIAFYPVAGKGVVNGSGSPVRLPVGRDGEGNPTPPGRSIDAWGRFGVGVRACDRMSGQANVYGVKHVRLFVDDRQVFGSSISRFPFAKTRMLNAFVDFEYWRRSRLFYMKSFVVPGNTLPFYGAGGNGGYVDIDEERPYLFRYELEDHRGNRLTYQFTVNGKRQPLPPEGACDNGMAWNLYHFYPAPGFHLQIPDGNLYDDICFTHSSSAGNGDYFSAIHRVNDSPVPLHGRASIWIGLNSDPLRDKGRYGIVRVGDNGSASWLGGEYVHGGMTVSIRELGGRYAISADTVSPVITPVDPASWVSRRYIRLRLGDDRSGIASFRGEINGKFVLFTHDSKSSVYTCRFEDARIDRGEKQRLVFSAVDGAGNRREYSYTFFY